MERVLPAWERPGFCHHPRSSLSKLGVCAWCGHDTGLCFVFRVPLVRDPTPRRLHLYAFYQLLLDFAVKVGPKVDADTAAGWLEFIRGIMTWAWTTLACFALLTAIAGWQKHSRAHGNTSWP